MLPVCPETSIPLQLLPHYIFLPSLCSHFLCFILKNFCQLRHTHILKSPKFLLPTSIFTFLEESISTLSEFLRIISPYFQISLYASFFSDSLTTINDEDLAFFHPSPSPHTLNLSHTILPHPVRPLWVLLDQCLVLPAARLWSPVMEDNVQMFA